MYCSDSSLLIPALVSRIRNVHIHRRRRRLIQKSFASYIENHGFLVSSEFAEETPYFPLSFPCSTLFAFVLKLFSGRINQRTKLNLINPPPFLPLDNYSNSSVSKILSYSRSAYIRIFSYVSYICLFVFHRPIKKNIPKSGACEATFPFPLLPPPPNVSSVVHSSLHH